MRRLVPSTSLVETSRRKPRFFVFMNKEKLIQFIKENKYLILGLIYLISPIDIIPDFLLPIGFADDLFVVVAALAWKFTKFYFKERILNIFNSSDEEFKGAKQSPNSGNVGATEREDVLEGEIIND